MKENFVNTHKILDEANVVMNEGRKSKIDGTLEQAKNRIFSPLASIDYSKNDVEVIKDEFGLSFNKKVIEQQDWHIIRDFTKKNSLESADSEWISVDQLVVIFDKKRLDLSGLLPPEYSVLVNPNCGYNMGTLYPGARKIVIAGNLASIGTLFILLHEIGHINDFDKLEKLGEEKLTEGGLDFENMSAEELRREREASLFALRKIWPIFKKNSQLKSDVMMFAKDFAYASYGEQALDIRNIRYDDGGWEDAYDE